MRSTLLIILALFGSAFSWAQEGPSGPEAVAKVLRVLKGEEQSAQVRLKFLKRGAWEALAYLATDSVAQADEGDLAQAVPDYYRFREEQVLLKLIDQENSNRYGLELNLPYQVEVDQIIVYDDQGKKEKARWQILYLDDNYLALNMDGLRLFFSRTAPQE